MYPQVHNTTPTSPNVKLQVSAHALLILHVPGLTERGLRSSELVEFVDIFPTLVEAAGLGSLEKCPENSRNVSVCREGMSLLRIVQGKSPTPTLLCPTKNLNL